MNISLIVAMDKHGVIGANNKLPWRLSADLKHFKSVTMGKPIIMGRKTHESIGRILPGRENIVITGNENYEPDGAVVFNDLASAFDYCVHAEEIIIMGGAELYSQTLPMAERLYITEVHTECVGDTFFPDFNREEFQEIDRQDYKADSDNEHDYSFVILDRRLN